MPLSPDAKAGNFTLLRVVERAAAHATHDWLGPMAHGARMVFWEFRRVRP